jgi:hypothetical protein
MAAKKTKSRPKFTKATSVAASPAKKAAKRVVKKAAKKAKGLLGQLAQRSAQLILDTGLLGEAPKPRSKRATAKKSAAKAGKKPTRR